MVSTAFVTNSDKVMLEIASAVKAIRTLIRLAGGADLNRKRFESCKNQVLQLKLSAQAKIQINGFFDSANNYIKFGEIGALLFEMSLLAQFLDIQLDNQIRKSAT